MFFLKKKRSHNTDKQSSHKFKLLGGISKMLLVSFLPISFLPIGIICLVDIENIYTGLGFLFLSLVSITILISVISKRIVEPIQKLSSWGERIAVGDLSYTDFASGKKDEIGVLGASFREVVDSYKELTEVCESIAIGDFSRSVRVRGESDTLAKAVNEMAGHLMGVVKQANSIANGDYTTQVSPRSEKDELGAALFHMTGKLREVTTKNEKALEEAQALVQKVERENWIREGQALLVDRMRGEQPNEDLCQNIISFISERTQAEIGSVYIIDSKDRNVLRLMGTYAYDIRDRLAKTYQIGAGLIGQAALDRNIRVLSDLPSDYVKISSSLGEAFPKNILLVPFIYDEKVEGVIELGSFHSFSEAEIAFLERVSGNIAVAKVSADARGQMEDLLNTSQHLAEDLQNQQEELSQINEDLGEQTRALRESEARLQTQQEELRQTNEELEEQTLMLQDQKKAIEIKNKELETAHSIIEQKAKDIETASKYKSEFLANMSHELRTPLNSMLLLSKLLSDNKDGNLSVKQVEFAGIIHSAGSDLLQLINGILDLSKVEAGKMEIHPESVALNDMATHMRFLFEPIAREKGIFFKALVSEELPDSICSDRQRLEQIIKNLLSNAFKFTGTGGVTLRITRPEQYQPESGLVVEKTVAFSVIDTGLGIPKSKQTLIFEAFKQADGTTSRKYGGTGLGLSISRELARLLQGEIHLESEEGKGSVFTLYVPESLQEIGSKPKEPAMKKRSVVAAVTSKVMAEEKSLLIEEVLDDRREIAPGDRSMLIIEDDPTFATILRNLSREKKFKALVAGDGEIGLQFADYYKPMGILLDLNLPGIDGWGILTRLKNNLQTRHIPVHIISSSDLSRDAMRMGAIGFLTKPVNMNNVDDVFDRIYKIASSKTKRLLLIEADENQRKTLSEFLGDNNISIFAATNGNEACHALKTELFDCIVIDPDLPDMQGIDLLKDIKGDEKLAHVPVVVYASEISIEEKNVVEDYAEKVILQGTKSHERLFDEAALYLHLAEADLSEQKLNLLRLAHDSDLAFQDRVVMVVDDDMRNVYALTSLLEGKGMRILPGRNGREAIAKLQDHPEVELVLMDIMMPDMDGYEAMKAIRKQSRFTKLPIIAVTAKAMKGDRQKCIDAGASDYLTKPIDTERLLSLLRVWLYR
ncbi:MAG: response regulator [Pseudomonadota bacterium]